MRSESEVQQRIMIEAAKHGITLMRNNSGAGTFVDEVTGATSHVRFGLGNESKTHNEKWKSSDLIGIWPCYEYGVGIFIAVEVKKEGWTYGPQKGKSKKDLAREEAQLAFINWVRARCGVAGFCASELDFLKLIGKA